jgi:hypothetical protein
MPRRALRVSCGWSESRAAVGKIKEKNKSLKTLALESCAVSQSRSPIVIRHGSEVENTSSQEGDSVMQARMKNPAMIIPGAM